MTPAAPAPDRSLPPVLGRLLRGTFWLALKTPLQVVIAFWSIPLVQHALGVEANGAYVFAWGFGFVQLLLEFGMGSALQGQVARVWPTGDRAALNRLIACGTTFYAVVAVAQMAILLTVAYFGLPSRFTGESRRLIVGLLWLQTLSAPFFGLLTVVSSVLQAARRYEFLPRLDLLVVVLRFAVLVVGLRLGVDFLAIVGLQMAIQVGIVLGPALWVLVRELGYTPRFTGAGWGDYAALFRISVYLFLIQLSIVLADKVDTTVLGYALSHANPGRALTVYQNVSKPFFQIRQTAWTLAYLVMPAAAGLAAVGDDRGLEHIKYDGTRLLLGLLLPVTLLAVLYAEPFLTVWVGPRFAPDAPLLRLFLIATLPLPLSILVQIAIGMGKISVLAVSTLLGSLVNLPLSYYLTIRLGVSGVIWGTVLTTVLANFLVPGVYLFKTLEIRPALFLTRTLSAPLAGASALAVAAWACRSALSPDPIGPTVVGRFLPLLINLGAGSAAYLLGYTATAIGRADAILLIGKLRAQNGDRPKRREPT